MTEKTYDDADVRSALWEAGGILADAARIISKKIGRPVSRSTISRAVAKSPWLQEALERVRETKIDYAEQSLWQKIEAGEERSLHLYLTTVGRGRGYVRRDEITTPPGQPIKVQTTTDWSRLSQDQLRLMLALKARADGKVSPVDEVLVERGLLPPLPPRDGAS